MGFLAPFTVNFFLELFLNYDQLTYKNLLRNEYAVKSLATIYFRVASELMNMMTSPRCLATKCALFIAVYL